MQLVTTHYNLLMDSGLKSNFSFSVEKMGIKDDFIFMQYNDPKNTACNIRMWILHNSTPAYLKTPLQFPDINPIEHLWNYLERQIRKHQISSKEDLKKCFSGGMEQNFASHNIKFSQFNA